MGVVRKSALAAAVAFAALGFGAVGASAQDRGPAVATKDIEVLRQEIRDDARRRDVTVICAIGILGGIFWLALHRAPFWPGAALILVSAISLWYSRR